MLDMGWFLPPTIRSLVLCSHSTLNFLFQNNHVPRNRVSCLTTNLLKVKIVLNFAAGLRKVSDTVCSQIFVAVINE